MSLILVLVTLLFCGVYGFSEPFGTGVKATEDEGYCGPNSYGIEYVLHKMQPDYGWGEDTHRAVVILELNSYEDKDRLKMKLVRHQLEIELTGVMLKNSGSIPSKTDLALYIQALLAIGKDPRDFYGINLVDDLLKVVKADEKPHPFLLVVLCSCGALSDEHLVKIRHLIHGVDGKTGQDKELAAIALKAFACWTKVNKGRSWQNLEQEVNKAADALASLQKSDGSFGNVYATALIAQALKILNNHKWDEKSALDFLVEDRETRVNNILLNYYIEMALHADAGLFLKNEAIATHTDEGFLTTEFLKTMKRSYFVHYTVKVGEMPDMYHSLTIKVPENITFFDVMRLAAEDDSKFNFSYTMVQDLNRHVKKPDVYRISGIPNDAEHGLFWRLVHENDINHDRHSSRMQERIESPHDLKPVHGTHYIYWYCDISKDLNGVVSGSRYRPDPRLTRI